MNRRGERFGEERTSTKAGKLALEGISSFKSVRQRAHQLPAEPRREAGGSKEARICRRKGQGGKTHLKSLVYRAGQG